jgi:hypothetical protein
MVLEAIVAGCVDFSIVIKIYLINITIDCPAEVFHARS